MWSETVLKACVEAKLEYVFGQPVAVLDLDTYNTPVGRPDAVLLNRNRQLVVVEFETQLTLRNIEHALLDQAWRCAVYWHSQAKQSDIIEMYRYYRKYRFPHQDEIPDIRGNLGLPNTDDDLWDRGSKCIVVAGAWRVDGAVYEKARALMESRLAAEHSRMPCEAWIYEIDGDGDHSGAVQVRECRRRRVFEYEGSDPEAEGPGLRTPRQHLPTTMTPEFQRVAELLPRFLSNDLESYVLFSKANWKSRLLKLAPWGTESGVWFEFSRMDSANEIKGPHCQLCITQRKELGVQLREHLRPQWPEIASALGCTVGDLACQRFSYPIKQHRIDDRSPEAIARGFGRFCSVIYPRISAIVTHVLDP